MGGCVEVDGPDLMSGFAAWQKLSVESHGQGQVGPTLDTGAIYRRNQDWIIRPGGGRCGRRRDAALPVPSNRYWSDAEPSDCAWPRCLAFLAQGAGGRWATRTGGRPRPSMPEGSVVGSSSSGKWEVGPGRWVLRGQSPLGVVQRGYAAAVSAMPGISCT